MRTQLGQTAIVKYGERCFHLAYQSLDTAWGNILFMLNCISRTMALEFVLFLVRIFLLSLHLNLLL